MPDETKYREMFSQVRASEETFRRVMTMRNENNKRPSGRTVPRLALVAALIVLMALTVSASETVQNWFVDFFGGLNREGLSQEQVEYIEEKTKTIQDSQTHNGWTVELNSAIRDDNTAYIIFHIAGPENVDLSKWTDEEGEIFGQVMFSNSCTPRTKSHYFDFHEHIQFGGWGETWQDDGDGLQYTANLVFHIEPDVPYEEVDPFGAETVYHFRFEDIVWFWTNRAYELELKEGKYAGQEFPQFTEEELSRIYCMETLAEGVWEFEISFAQLEYVAGESMELPD